jgi:Na+(H+)/acetate symporter ActP
MQFLILLTGVMVLVFHQFEKPPIFFNEPEWNRVLASSHAGEALRLEGEHDRLFEHKRRAALALDAALAGGDAVARAAATKQLKQAGDEARAIHTRARELVAQALPRAESQDADYIFLGFILDWLPRGLVGLLLAVILCAAMSSSAGELAALGTTTVVDFYRRSWRKGASDLHYLWAARVFTGLWGCVAVAFATFASLVDNLIEAVNILGSLFYGPILGIFLTAFFTRNIRGTAVFMAALLAEIAVIAFSVLTDVGYLWWNVVGCGLVWLFAVTIQGLMRPPEGA